MSTISDKTSAGTRAKVFTNTVSKRVAAFGHAIWDRVNKLTNNYVSYLAQATQNFINKGVNESVIFGYWSVFSLFPLVMLGIVVATFALGPDSAKMEIRNTLSQFIPGGGGTLISDNINQAISQRGSFGIVGLIGLVYGAAGLFMNLQFNLSRIFRDKEQRSWPIQLIIGVLMLIALAILIIASIVVSGLFTVVGRTFLGDKSPLFNIFVSISAGVLPLLIDSAMFIMLFRLVPQRKIAWRALIPGAVLGAVLWELSKNLFGWYVVNLANFGLMYGSLGTVIGLLTWTYLTGCLISLCAEGSVATDDWFAKRAPAVTVAEPVINKPADELPMDAPGKVADIDLRAAEVQQSID